LLPGDTDRHRRFQPTELYWTVMARRRCVPIPVPVYSDAVADDLPMSSLTADVKFVAAQDQEQVRQGFVCIGAGAASPPSIV